MFAFTANCTTFDGFNSMFSYIACNIVIELHLLTCNTVSCTWFTLFFCMKHIYDSIFLLHLSWVQIGWVMIIFWRRVCVESWSEYSDDPVGSTKAELVLVGLPPRISETPLAIRLWLRQHRSSSTRHLHTTFDTPVGVCVRGWKIGLKFGSLTSTSIAPVF